MIGSVNLSAWFPTGASTHAAGVDGPFYGIYVVATCVLIVVAGLAVIFMRSFTRKDGDPDQVPAGGLHKPLLGLWVLAAVLLAAFAFQSGLSGFVDQNVAPYGAYQVGVSADTGGWSFTYPNGHVADTLRVQVDQPVQLTLTTTGAGQNLSIPALRVQQAILPGRTTSTWFAATTPGDYPIYSGAFSPAGQDSLRTELMAMSQADFVAWLATIEDIFIGRTLAEVGELLYTKQGCMVCHTLDGSKLVGPSFKDVYGHAVETADGRTVLADDAYIKESILTPNAVIVAGYQPVMTPYAGKLDDREIGAITEFLKSLSDLGHTGAEAAADTAAATTQEEK